MTEIQGQRRRELSVHSAHSSGFPYLKFVSLLVPPAVRGKRKEQVCERNRWLQMLLVFATHIVCSGLIVRKLGLLADGCQFKSLNRPGKSGLGKESETHLLLH